MALTLPVDALQSVSVITKVTAIGSEDAIVILLVVVQPKLSVTVILCSAVISTSAESLPIVFPRPSSQWYMYGATPPVTVT